VSELSDRAVARLRRLCETPDFTGTRYRIVDEIGRGGMGTVYRAEDRKLVRLVAIKVMAEPAVEPSAAERMLAEARVVAHLEHPGIVPVYDAGTLADGRVYYAMKLVAGRRLGEYAAAASLADRLRVFARICEAVAFAHSRGVVHRDLKPENVMTGAFGEVLVMDWGVAKVAGVEEAPGTIAGTPRFMAPEQACGDAAATGPRSDVYSLGAILRYVCEGSEAKKPLAAIAAKAMSERAEDRYASAAELEADVLRFLDGEAVSAYRETVAERVARFVDRNRALVLLVMTYLVVRFALLAWSLR
jgi:serine/threonine protein kinase